MQISVVSLTGQNFFYTEIVRSKFPTLYCLSSSLRYLSEVNISSTGIELVVDISESCPTSCSTYRTKFDSDKICMYRATIHSYGLNLFKNFSRDVKSREAIPILPLKISIGGDLFQNFLRFILTLI